MFAFACGVYLLEGLTDIHKPNFTNSLLHYCEMSVIGLFGYSVINRTQATLSALIIVGQLETIN